MAKKSKRVTRQRQLMRIKQKLTIKRPILVKIKQKTTLKRQEIMKNRQKLIINKNTSSSPLLVPKALSDAGRLLFDPKSPADVKRVAASRLRVEQILKALERSKFRKRTKKRKNKY